jgi:ribonuclease BN (tRNA processing enzyme)
MDARILGSGGWMPSEQRETACVLLRDGADALVLDAGSGLRRLVGEPALLDGAQRLDIVLTHFHLDHVCGLGYVPALALRPTIWAPGRWLYDRRSADILAPLRATPISPFDEERLGAIRELEPGEQAIGAFTVAVRAQPRHWDPTAGLRVGDALALVTDTAYDPESGPFALGVAHLLHGAWSTTASPASTEGDATAAQAGRVAAEAGARRLTLIHLRPPAPDEDALLADARDEFPAAEIGRDGMALVVD